MEIFLQLPVMIEHANYGKQILEYY